MRYNVGTKKKGRDPKARAPLSAEEEAWEDASDREARDCSQVTVWLALFTLPLVDLSQEMHFLFDKFSDNVR